MREWIEEVRRRLASARLDGASERDIAEELAQHLQDRYAELRAGGESEAEARARVLAELGEGDALARQVRGSVPERPVPIPVGGTLDGLYTDLRHAVRTLLRTPLFAGFAVLVIALGVGANTAVFTVIDSVLLRPPTGVVEPERLTAIHTSDYSGPLYGASSYPDVEAMQAVGNVFDGVAAYSLQTFSVIGDGWTERGMGEIVSGEYFRVLGVQPAAGRFFAPDEAEPGRAALVAVIGHDLWRRRYAGRPDAVGSTITVRGQPLTIIGVVPADFSGSMHGLRTHLWLPLGAPASFLGMDASNRGNRSFLVRARLRDGVDVRAAQEALNVAAARLHSAFPEMWTDVTGRTRVVTILPESEARVPRQARGAVLGVLGAALAAVFVVLLIACTNVANLMLSRAAVRRGEMGVRIALGATRGRIVRHLLAESVLLALAGGIAGVLLAFWSLRLLSSVRLPGLHVTVQVGMDWRVLVFAAFVTLATGIAFGLAPALQASRAPAPLLKDDGRAARRTRLRRGLIVVQVASSLVLLIVGGLLVRSLLAMQGVETGYRADPVVLATFDLDSEGYAPERAAGFYDELLPRVAALPGAASVTLAREVPLGMGWSRRSIRVEGYTASPGEDMEVPNNGVGPGWFGTMGMTLVRGRDFTDGDRAGAPPVVIVSEAFARRFWPGLDPLGRRVGLEGPDAPFAEVIGVAPDAKYRSVDAAPEPYFYYPHLQQPTTNLTLFVRAAGDPAPLVSALRDAIRAQAPSLPLPTVHTFRDHLALARLPQRVAALAASGLGLLAVGIALIGLYGLVAFGVAQRAREFGIRMALGAAGADVRRLVQGDALRLVGLGIVCGAPVALGAAFLLRGFLLTPSADPVTFLAVPALLAACALFASHIPARRAARQDPAITLRAE